jgi:hypothetical protein
MPASDRHFEVFISHSRQDAHAASAIKQHLQTSGLKCWKAPDDIYPGESWPSAITRALSACRVMVLVWSRNSLASPEVSKELTIAMRNGLTVIPFRIEDVQPTSEWDYHLANTHWMDAFPGDLAIFVESLAARIQGVIGNSNDSAIPPAAPLPYGRNVSSATNGSGSRFLVGAAVLSALFLIAALGVWFFMQSPERAKQSAVSATKTSQTSAQETETLSPEAGKAGAEQYFAKLAADIARSAPSQESNVGVGNFVFEDTEMLSSLSSLLRDELEFALGKTDKFNVVLHGRLADLQRDGKFHGKGILEPGSNIEGVSIEGIDGIVRGRFYANENNVTIFAESIWLKDGRMAKARVVIPTAAIGTRIWPDLQQAAAHQLAGVINPQNAEQSLASIQDVKDSRLADVPQNFQVEVFTADGKRGYAEGETVSFRVRSAEECHIAVLCHQSDGNTVVLYPNRFASDTLIPANKPIDVPGTHISGFEIVIGPPFGSDVVEVIACSKPSDLHKTLSQFASTSAEQQPFQVLTRGMAVKGIDSALSSPKTGDGAPLRWGQDSIVVSTFPRP